MASTYAISQLSLELSGGQVTTEAHILPPGPFRSEDGRPAECSAWQLDADIAARLIAKLAAKKTDTLIDYEHQSLRAERNGKPVPAAGWFSQLRWQEGSGLYATGVCWTEDARKMIAKREYRYISAVFAYNSVTGEIVEIISVALTNTPAIDGLQALADLARQQFTQPQDDGEDDMAQDQAAFAALTVENSSLKSSVADLTKQRDDLNVEKAALTKERDTLKDQVAALTKEKADAAAAADKKQHDDLLAAALTDGRLLPAQKAWAEKQSLTALTEYLDATKPVAMLTKQADGKDGGDANHGLNADELAMCTKMGVKPEDYVKTKAAK